MHFNNSELVRIYVSTSFIQNCSIVANLNLCNGSLDILNLIKFRDKSTSITS